MTAEQEQVEALAAWFEENLTHPTFSDWSNEDFARAVLASDWLAEHDAQVRAEATAAVVAQVEELAADFESEIDWSDGRDNYGDNAAWESAARRLRALPPDAGAALRAREAKALRDAADALAVDSSLTTGVRPDGDYNDARDDERIDNVQWLRDRADDLEAGDAR